jgi:hypothetical protein
MEDSERNNQKLTKNKRICTVILNNIIEIDGYLCNSKVGEAIKQW